MYESPIEIIYTGMEQQLENDVLKVIQRYGIKVDKNELIKALRYDRNQYEKGFKDGAEQKAKWIPCSEQEPTVSGEYMITWVFKWNDIVRRYIGISRYDSSAVEWYKNSMMCTYEEVKVVAWMPLPEPYKEAEE